MEIAWRLVPRILTGTGTTIFRDPQVLLGQPVSLGAWSCAGRLSCHSNVRPEWIYCTSFELHGPEDQAQDVIVLCSPQTPLGQL